MTLATWTKTGGGAGVVRTPEVRLGAGRSISSGGGGMERDSREWRYPLTRASLRPRSSGESHSGLIARRQLSGSPRAARYHPRPRNGRGGRRRRETQRLKNSREAQPSSLIRGSTATGRLMKNQHSAERLRCMLVGPTRAVQVYGRPTARPGPSPLSRPCLDNSFRLCLTKMECFWSAVSLASILYHIWRRTGASGATQFVFPVL